MKRTPHDPDADPLLGQIVDGRYQVRRVIGRGGMGMVYEAEAIRLARRPCALKVLLPEFTRNTNARARFKREAEIAGRVKHPNLVETLDTGTTRDGRGYLVMELLRGESLDLTLRREGPLPWARAQHIILQICGALAAAHAEKIMHRDMKPENCFRSALHGDPDFIKVLDFGIARLTDVQDNAGPRLTATDAVIGTCAYMAYEQVRGEALDHRVDVWALGVMLYEMLTGSMPFRGHNQGQIWTAICTHDPEPMQNVAPGAVIPAAAEAVVRRALSRARDDRFPTVEALACAIADVTASRNVTVVPASRTRSAPPPLPKTSPTFVCGPTAAQERPHSGTWAALEAEERGETGETPGSTPRPVTGAARHTELAPARERMDTAAVGEATYTVLAFTPVSPGPKRMIWPLTGLGLMSVALAVWLSQGTADEPAQQRVPEEVTNLVIEVPHAAPLEPPPAPASEPDLILPDDEPTEPTEPIAPAPESTSPTATKPRTYKQRIVSLLDSVSHRKARNCFVFFEDSLYLTIEVNAQTGKPEVKVSANNPGPRRDKCITDAFQAVKLPRDPGGANVVVRYILSKAGGRRLKK